MQTITINVEQGATASSPKYRDHKRARNWAATIRLDPTQPGGLSRAFWPRAKGEWYYMVPPSLAAGDAVEFAADYYSCGGRKSVDRWYGTVVSVSGQAVVIEEHATAREAVEAGVPPAPAPGVDLSGVSTEALYAELARRGVAEIEAVS